MTGNRARWTGGLLTAAVLVTAGCGSDASGTGAIAADSSAAAFSGGSAAAGGSLPPGVMSAARACRQLVGGSHQGMFTGVERVHLVLTTYAKGEPVESQGDISYGMPPRTLVWVVEVHAQAIHSDHSVPPASHAPARPATDFSVVMNARTGRVTDSGEGNSWPLPLSGIGTLVSLSPQC